MPDVNKCLIIIAFCIGLLYSSFTKDDTIIVTKIITNLSIEATDTVYISENASNLGITAMYESNFNDSLIFKREESKIWLATKAGNNKEKDDSNLLREVFSRNNYSYVKQQVSNYNWQDKNIQLDTKTYRIKIVNESAEIFTDNKLTISKPVYTKDGNYALVIYKYKSMDVLVIYQQNRGEWNEVKFIPLGIS